MGKEFVCETFENVRHVSKLENMVHTFRDQAMEDWIALHEDIIEEDGFMYCDSFGSLGYFELSPNVCHGLDEAVDFLADSLESHPHGKGMIVQYDDNKYVAGGWVRI